MKTIVAQVYLKKDNKILMVQENKEGKKGKWNMPAGKLEENESIIEAAIREMKEETNLNINITGLIAIQESITELGQLLILYFKGEYISGNIEFNENEISQVRWMTKEEIENLDKNSIRGSETIDSILSLADQEPISLDRIKIENFLNKENSKRKK